jgi:hypothetical protein
VPDKLDIQIDDSLAQNGDIIKGKVRVLEPIDECKSLDLFLLYQGKKFGERQVDKICLTQGKVEPPDFFDFQFQIPLNAPFSFKGHAHNLEWMLRAAADVPWAIDPKAERPFTVKPPQIAVTDQAIAEATSEKDAEPEKMSMGCQVLLYVFLAPLIIMLLPIILIFIARKKIIDTRLTDFIIEAPERRMVLGEWVPVSVRFQLKRAIEINSLKITLQGVEYWTTGSGKSKRTHTHKFHEQDASFLENTVLAVAPDATNGEVVVTTSMWIPPYGLPSVPPDAVYYKVHAVADIAGFPDPSAEKKIQTVGALLSEPDVAPEDRLVTETSKDVFFLEKGGSPPAGVDARTRDPAIWMWVLIPTVGLAVSALGTFLAIEESQPFVLLAGVPLLGIGLLGFYYKLYR